MLAVCKLFIINCVCRDVEIVSAVSSDENLASVITMAETVINKVNVMELFFICGRFCFTGVKLGQFQK